MNMLDVDAIRAQVRALDFTRGTPADAAMRREDDADARANLAIEGMALDAGEHALFDMLREEAARSTATKPAYRSASSILRGPCRSEEHTSELQSLMRISYAVFCLKKKKRPPGRNRSLKIAITWYISTPQHVM